MGSRIFAGSMMVVALAALGGCEAPDSRNKIPGNRQSDGWTTVPTVEAVRLHGEQVTITGVATPDARVLLRGDEGENHAVAADAGGRFTISLKLNDDSVVLTPEVQQGQATVRGPDRLVILTEARLAVLQTDSGASRRLSPGPRLDAIDGDGQVLVASGRAAPQQTVRVRVPDAFQTEARAGNDGRWSVTLSGLRNQPMTLTVEEHEFHYPGPGPQPAGSLDQVVTIWGQGWYLSRRVGDRSILTSWFPNP